MIGSYLHVIYNVHNVVGFIEATDFKQDFVAQERLSRVFEYLKNKASQQKLEQCLKPCARLIVACARCYLKEIISKQLQGISVESPTGGITLADPHAFRRA